MPIILGGTGDVGGGFANLGEIYARGIQHAPQQRPLNLTAGGSYSGGGGQDPNALIYREQSVQAQQQQRAELQNWLMQQDMTTHEQMRLQQQQNAVAQIGSDPNLSPQEKQQAITQLRTGIDIGRQRMQATQQRHMQLQNQVLQQQEAQAATIQNENARFHAAGFPASQSYSIDPQGEQEVRDELGQWLQPGEQLNDRDVLTEAQRRGYVTRMHQHRPGQWEAAQREGVPPDEQGRVGRGGERLPPGVMNEDTWHKHYDAIAKRVDKMTDSEGKPLSGEAQTNRLHEELNRAGLNWSHSDYLDSHMPGRRENREAGQRRVQQINDGMEATRQRIDRDVNPEDRGALRATVDRIHQAEIKYANKQMPAIIRRRITEWSTAINDTINRQREFRAEQAAAAAPGPTSTPTAPPVTPAPAPGRPLRFGPGGYQATSLFGS